MGGGIIMTRYSNYEIDILKPSLKEIKRMRAFAKYRGWSIYGWFGDRLRPEYCRSFACNSSGEYIYKVYEREVVNGKV